MSLSVDFHEQAHTCCIYISTKSELQYFELVDTINIVVWKQLHEVVYVSLVALEYSSSHYLWVQ